MTRGFWGFGSESRLISKDLIGFRLGLIFSEKTNSIRQPFRQNESRICFLFFAFYFSHFSLLTSSHKHQTQLELCLCWKLFQWKSDKNSAKMVHRDPRSLWCQTIWKFTDFIVVLNRNSHEFSVLAKCNVSVSNATKTKPSSSWRTAKFSHWSRVADSCHTHVLKTVCPADLFACSVSAFAQLVPNLETERGLGWAQDQQLECSLKMWQSNKHQES